MNNERSQPPTALQRNSVAVEWPTPRAAYIHVPFCRHRCGYCNFSVIAGRDGDYDEAYLQALTSELSSLQQPRPVDTLFIGGGTPTHLTAGWLSRLLALVTHWFPLNNDGEFSVEANPRDIEPEKLSVLASAGVNRISLGVQSFDSETLRILERDHDATIAHQAIAHCADIFPQVSVDLIFGAPCQSLSRWQHDLSQFISSPATHVSTYGLTFEKGTRFWSLRDRGELTEVGEDLELEMYQTARRELANAGFKHYEISNFAQPGGACRHNMAYWEGRGWYAAGPGAARFVDGYRQVNHRSTTTYVRRVLAGESPISESEAIDRETWAVERLVFGLRMLAGVDLDVIQNETQIDLKMIRKSQLEKLINDGWLIESANRLRLSEPALVVSDAVLSELF